MFGFMISWISTMMLTKRPKKKHALESCPVYAYLFVAYKSQPALQLARLTAEGPQLFFGKKIARKNNMQDSATSSNIQTLAYALNPSLNPWWTLLDTKGGFGKGKTTKPCRGLKARKLLRFRLVQGSLGCTGSFQKGSVTYERYRQLPEFAVFLPVFLAKHGAEILIQSIANTSHIRSSTCKMLHSSCSNSEAVKSIQITDFSSW